MAQGYAVRSPEEAKAYFDQPVLGPRLWKCAAAVLAIEGRSARDIMGLPDDMKIRFSVTLFALVDGPDSVFARVLAKYFGGTQDSETLRRLGSSPA